MGTPRTQALSTGDGLCAAVLASVQPAEPARRLAASERRSAPAGPAVDGAGSDQERLFAPPQAIGRALLSLAPASGLPAARHPRDPWSFCLWLSPHGPGWDPARCGGQPPEWALLWSSLLRSNGQPL